MPRYDVAAAGGSTTVNVVGDEIPVGAIMPFAGSAAPGVGGWLMCDGNAVPRATYADLFAVIGTAYGAGDGATTFNLPDLRQRFPLGKAAAGTGSALGATGGTIDHTHATAAGVTGTPSATAAMTGGVSPINTATNVHTHTVPATVSDAKNPPFLVINYLVKT